MTVVVTILTGGVWREALTDPPVQPVFARRAPGFLNLKLEVIGF
jgi:hypothetical protein